MKKKTVIALLAVAALALTACTASQEMRGTYQGDDGGDDGNNGHDGNDGNDGGDEDYSNVELPENEMIILSHSTNGAWYIEDNGVFVYSDGTAYGFDFDKQEYGSYDFDDYIRDERRYELIRKYVGAGSDFEKQNGRIYLAGIDEDVLKHFYYLGTQVDPNAGFKDEQWACDMGQRTLYFVDHGKKIEICSSGDVNYTPKDKNAKKFQKLWKEDNAIDTSVVKYVHVYDGSDYPLVNPEWGYDPDHEGCHVFADSKELQDFAEETDWDANEILDLIDYEPDEYLYLVQIQNVNSGGYDLKCSGVIFYEDKVDLIPSENNAYPEGMVTEQMDGFCSVMALPKYLFDYTVPQLYHFDGTAWIYQ